jgi:hypothetical protein
MSRKLKKVLHAVEEKQAGVWRVIRVCDRKRDAEEFQLVQPDRRQIAVYERNEGTLRPGKCLWVVESRMPWLVESRMVLLPWVVYAVYPTLLEARAAMSMLKRPKFGSPRDVRLLRFVRRKERAW